MLLHVVFMQLRPGAASAELVNLTERVRELAKSVSGTDSCVIGPNITEEPLHHGYEFGFVLKFADHGALDAYHVNAAHLAVSLAIRDLANTVLVFDFVGSHKIGR